MKALTLTQPWATLVGIGAKRIETRSWATKHRGKLAIHAAKGYPADARQLCYQPPFRDVLLKEGYFSAELLLRGHIIAVCSLVACEKMTEPLIDMVPEPERSFGDYRPGRFMWMVEDVQPLYVPISAKGALGLWEWDEVGLKQALHAPTGELQ